MSKIRVVNKFCGRVETLSRSEATLTLSNRENVLTVKAPRSKLPKGVKVGDRLYVKVLERNGWVKTVFEEAKLNLSKKQWEKCLKESERVMAGGWDGVPNERRENRE